MMAVTRIAGKLANRIMGTMGLRVVRTAHYGVGWDIDRYAERHRLSTPRYLNIGAGNWYHPLWHSLDNPSDWYSKAQSRGIDIKHDLMSQQPFPLSDASLKAVYTSHTIEHMRDEDVSVMFVEVYRCLARGGVLSCYLS